MVEPFDLLPSFRLHRYWIISIVDRAGCPILSVGHLFFTGIRNASVVEYVGVRNHERRRVRRRGKRDDLLVASARAPEPAGAAGNGEGADAMERISSAANPVDEQFVAVCGYVNPVSD